MYCNWNIHDFSFQTENHTCKSSEYAGKVRAGVKGAKIVGFLLNLQNTKDLISPFHPTHNFFDGHYTSIHLDLP